VVLYFSFYYTLCILKHLTFHWFTYSNASSAYQH